MRATEVLHRPWLPVERAVITHAHADHARLGHAHYLTASPGAQVLKSRLGDITLEALPYGKKIIHNGVTVSLHPAGHVLGSAQVRLEYRGEVWVASGDYKLEPDGTCDAFEPVACDTFITESTFGLPIYRWDAQITVFDDICPWWRRNAEEGRTSVLFCYAFGKAQRILNGIDSTIGPIICHGATATLNRAYRESGVALPSVLRVSDVSAKEVFRKALVIAPPQPRAPRGCGGSATIATLSQAGGCYYVEPGGAARWIGASSFPTMQTGRV